jgi:hypothetical protein
MGLLRAFWTRRGRECVVFVSGGQQQDTDGGSGGRVFGLEVERCRGLPEMISVSITGE